MPISMHPVINPKMLIGSDKFRNMEKAERKVYDINQAENCRDQPLLFQKNHTSGRKTRIDPFIFLV